ncbi:response regulator transcription factor [Halalkalibacterium halodurans]|jgi:NarL family two-component system response regulator LiaR|uniref:Two-component response regulator n=2 Tax=Halalkalibacterium halodurans TaxID=86665 RepID=Q9KDL2_HALH5|nr:response regulator transcription factor [Halalkalibacterium halodurans]MDY7221724.1 response regulator transcription factor [Halalkalibacterium halodurans]MDY7241000.1 response regulator transcription factor [Halalkalibacterium halodurans]MED3645586.1 response regulator transcription factor [Halalkalibacterium halodurans]MED4079398.1 response regulator transcription factor [Halalkalibacterium halodurans]MED4085469.1 response regulator transcription factor [Halalkalibacterium halodurans]
MIKVVLVDDHEMVRMGLSAYLRTQSDIEIVGEASDGHQGVKLVQETKPDVVLMDLVMEKMDGVQATEAIMNTTEGVKVIVLTSYIDDEKVYPVIEAGAFSYLLKTSSAKEIASAIRAAANGEAVVEAKVTNKMMERMRSRKKELHEELTPRELEVLRLIGEGKSNQGIADELYIGIKTVKTHVSNILHKLQLEDRTQIAVYAHRHRLVE